MIWQVLVVEIIRSLWGKGLYRTHPVLKRMHDEWFPIWVEWKTKATMKEVDKQIEEMSLESEVDPPVFSEELEGETPLGGKLKLRAPWLDEDDNP